MIHWDPPREAFFIPFTDFPVYWYSIFFAFGFFLSFLFVRKKVLLASHSLSIDDPKKAAFIYTEQLAWYLFFGLLIGARLGHVLFYDAQYFLNHPLEILNTRAGGLASHGGVIGCGIALVLFWKKHKQTNILSFWQLSDILTPAALLMGGWIRIGNFFNQEILGTPSTAPWAVWFGTPQAQAPILPCHPVQIYEAIGYFSLFFFSLLLTKRNLVPGKITALLFILTFSFRFLIEPFKLEQTSHELFLSTGQLLSIPFILFGAFFLFFKKEEKNG